MELLYAQNIVQPLKELFIQDKFSEIPEICIKPNSDLSLIASNITSLAITAPPMASESEQIGMMFDLISEFLDDTRNIARVQAIEHTSKAFASTLENSYTQFTEVIAPVVEEIKSSTTERFVELMTRERAESLLPDSTTEPSEEDYTFLRWEKLTAPIRQNEIIEAACQAANIASPALSTMNMGYIIRKIDFGREMKSINLSQETTELILTKLKDALVRDNSEVTTSFVDQAWACLTSNQLYKLFTNKISARFFAGKEIPQNCLYLIQLVNAFDTILENITKVIDGDLSAETMSDLRVNIDILAKTIYVIKYWLICMKEIRFKDKLIITSSIINGPVYEDFVRQSHGIDEIHNFIKALYLDGNIPIDGISIDTVLATDITEKLNNASSKLLANAAFIKSKCLYAAYEFAINKFITSETTKSLFPVIENAGFVARFRSIATTKASYLGGDMAKLDGVLYDLIISVFFSKTLIETMYKYLGKNFDNLANTAEDDITDQQIIEVQCDATIELLIDYLFDTVICKRSDLDGAVECVI